MNNILETASREELVDLIRRINLRLAALDIAEQENDSQVRTDIVGAVESLAALLGNPDDPPYDPANPGTVANIRSVRKHPPEVLEQNAGLVLALLLEGLEIIVVNNINIAQLVRSSD